MFTDAGNGFSTLNTMVFLLYLRKLPFKNSNFLVSELTSRMCLFAASYEPGN